MREFEVLKKLNHKNIVKLFAVEEEVGVTRLGGRPCGEPAWFLQLKVTAALFMPVCSQLTIKVYFVY